jgi:hypothetical protein
MGGVAAPARHWNRAGKRETPLRGRRRPHALHKHVTRAACGRNSGCAHPHRRSGPWHSAWMFAPVAGPWCPSPQLAGASSSVAQGASATVLIGARGLHVPLTSNRGKRVAQEKSGFWGPIFCAAHNLTPANVLVCRESWTMKRGNACTLRVECVESGFDSRTIVPPRICARTRLHLWGYRSACSINRLSEKCARVLRTSRRTIGN